MEEAKVKSKKRLGVRVKDFLLDIYSPKRIAKRLIKDIKENKIYYAIGLAIMTFIGITRIGMMDFDTGDLFQADVFAAFSIGMLNTSSIPALNFGEQLYNAVLPVGTALVVLYWLTELAGIAMRDQYTIEIMSMHMIKLIIGAVLLANGWEIMTSLQEFGDGLKELVTNNMTMPGKDALAGGNAVIQIADLILLLLPMLVMFALALISCFVLKLKLITRSLKLAVLFGFAPIGLADLAGGTHSTSMRYIKNIAALAIQGAVLTAICYAGGSLSTAFGTLDEATGLYSSLSIWDVVKTGIFSVTGIETAAIILTAIGLFSKSEDIARTIVGL